MGSNWVDVKVLQGETLQRMDCGGDFIDFETTTGRRFRMAHRQDCCENVVLEDVTGDIKDLLGEPLLQAEEVNNTDFVGDATAYESVTWTFYKFATIKGFVTLRWCGVSNGYYSESVDFVEVT